MSERVFSGLLPGRMFYNQPWPHRVPPGYYESIWTYQFLDDTGGLFPDVEVLLAIDQFAFLIGGLATVGFTYYTGDITQGWRLEWPPSDSWFEDLFPHKRVRQMGTLYVYIALRYLGRMAYGGFAYIGVRHLTCLSSITLFGGCGTTFRTFWAAGALYGFFWSSFYTKQAPAWNFLTGCWVGFGMSLLESLWGTACLALAEAGF